LDYFSGEILIAEEYVDYEGINWEHEMSINNFIISPRGKILVGLHSGIAVYDPDLRRIATCDLQSLAFNRNFRAVYLSSCSEDGDVRMFANLLASEKGEPKWVTYEIRERPSSNLII